MLTRQDYDSYLTQIGDIEQSMVIAYKKCIEVSKSDKVTFICDELMEQEKVHTALVRELRELLVDPIK